MKFSILATALALGQATAFTQSLVRNARAGTTALEDAGIPTDLLSPEQVRSRLAWMLMTFVNSWILTCIV